MSTSSFARPPLLPFVTISSATSTVFARLIHGMSFFPRPAARFSPLLSISLLTRSHPSAPVKLCRLPHLQRFRCLSPSLPLPSLPALHTSPSFIPPLFCLPCLCLPPAMPHSIALYLPPALQFAVHSCLCVRLRPVTLCQPPAFMLCCSFSFSLSSSLISSSLFIFSSLLTDLSTAALPLLRRHSASLRIHAAAPRPITILIAYSQDVQIHAV